MRVDQNIDECWDGNWGSGWRKYVYWDEVNKIYIYKGQQIIPLSFKEQCEMPVHLQNEYYWDEIKRINEISTACFNGTGENIDNVLSDLWKFWEK